MKTIEEMISDLQRIGLLKDYDAALPIDFYKELAEFNWSNDYTNPHFGIVWDYTHTLSGQPFDVIKNWYVNKLRGHLK